MGGILEKEVTKLPTSDLKAANPLTVPREALIELIQAKLTELQGLRDAGQVESKALDGPVHAAIAAFSEDELLAIFKAYFTIKVDDLSQFKRDKTFVPKAEKIPETEQRLANVIALLMASEDVNIELDSSSELYAMAADTIAQLRL